MIVVGATKATGSVCALSSTAPGSAGADAASGSAPARRERRHHDEDRDQPARGGERPQRLHGDRSPGHALRYRGRRRRTRGEQGPPPHWSPASIALGCCAERNRSEHRGAMLTFIEALNFRCLRYVAQDLTRFHVLVGPNASGKTTFLDVVAFLGRLVSSGP